MQPYELKIQGYLCRMCGSGRVELHHLLPRAKFGGRQKALQNSPSNCIPLCHVCHQNHHTTTKRVPRVLLTSDELAFLQEHIHPGWIDLWYPEGD
jgi:hypothetical protein